MTVKNLPKETIILKNSRVCKSIISKAKGLMFSRPIKDLSIVFDFKQEQIVVLHMLFVFFQIDILFLDKNKKVVDLRESVKPFTPYIKSEKPTKYVIELPQGTIKKSRTKKGDKISFVL